MRPGLVSGFAVLCCAGSAAAQTAPPLNPADPTQALPDAVAPSSPLDSSAVQRTPAASAPAATPPAAPSFVLQDVQFEGAAALSPSELAPAWQSYRGRAVTLRDLRVIAAAGERLYAAAGHPFVAFIVPAQDVSGGRVRIRVVEGHISDLTVVAKDPVARRQAAAAFGGLIGRDPLDADDVERAYDLAQEVPGLALAGSLRPGSQAGGMDLVVRADRRPWRFYANVNNFYPDPVGPWGVMLGAEYNGPSRYGDQTTLQLFTTTDISEQQVVRFSHARRLNAGGTTITGAILYADADPKGAVAPLDLATKVVAARLEVSQPLVVRRAFSATAALALDWTDQNTRVFSSVDLTEDHVRVLDARVSGRVGPAAQPFANYAVELRQGVAALGASRAGDADLSRLGADPQATVIKGDASGELAGKAPISLAWRVEGQWTDDSLTAPEEYIVGNLTTGRGYEPGASFGDRAIALSAEARLKPFHSGGALSLQPYAFVDAVKVWNEEPGAPNDRWVASVGGGVRIELKSQARFDIFYAQPLDAPLGLGEHKPGGGVYVNLTAAIPDIFHTLGAGMRRTVRP